MLKALTKAVADGRCDRPRRLPSPPAGRGTRRWPSRHAPPLTSRTSPATTSRATTSTGTRSCPAQRRPRPRDVGLRRLQLLRHRVPERRVLQGADTRCTSPTRTRRCRPPAVPRVQRAVQRVRQLPHVLPGERRPGDDQAAAVPRRGALRRRRGTALPHRHRRLDHGIGGRWRRCRGPTSPVACSPPTKGFHCRPNDPRQRRPVRGLQSET